MPREYKAIQQSLDPAMREVTTVGEVIETAASTWPDKQYATYAPTGDSFTFSEVASRATSVAASLAAAGVEEGDVVGLYLRNSIEYVTSIYACSKLGAIEAPIDWNYEVAEMAHALEAASISTVIAPADSDFVGTLIEAAADVSQFDRIILTGPPADIDSEDGAVDIMALADLMETATDAPPQPSVGWEDPVSIIFTSGTTGLPKPTLLANRSFILGAKSFRAAPFPDDDVNYNPYPMFHSNHQIFSLVGSAIVGTGYVFADSFSASAFADHVREFSVTSVNIIGGVPKMLDSTYDSADVTDLPLKVAIGPIPEELKDGFESKFGVTCVNIYGQSESPTLLMNHPDPTQIKDGSIGKPLFPDLGHEVTILDEDGTEVAPGEEGELTRTDPAAMLGYFGMPEATEETMKDGRIFSGDLAYQDEDGFLFYVGRKKLMIRRSGENISPQQVEDVIDGIEGVEESAVIPTPDDIHGDEVKAVVKRFDTDVSEADIVFAVARNLARYKTPRYVEFVTDFPRTPSERIKRNDLKEKEAQRSDHGWDRESAIPDWESRV